MDDEEFDGDEVIILGTDTYLPSATWMWRRLLVAALDSASNFLADTAQLVAAAVNADVDKRVFHDAATLEIETITQES